MEEELANLCEGLKVLLGLPWTFDRYLVSLLECKDRVALKDKDFSPIPFWIQLHDLLFTGMNKNMGEKLGERGRVINMGFSHLWIPFRYEHLPTFCLHCGVLLHPNSSCLGSLEGKQHEDGGNNKFQKDGLAKASGIFLHSGNGGGSYLPFEETSNCIGEPPIAANMPASTNL
ncbi:hypothetical protein I3843_03G198000 [Carya illinoinensis]|nr:hypothetical protein I3843_03G198000 [Carya illinoinensis]